MTLMIKSWPAPGTCGTPATGSPCDPCKPPPPGEGGPGAGLPFFTDAAINIYQYQIYEGSSGEILMLNIGQGRIYSAVDNIPPLIAWGTPATLGPIEYGFVSTWVGYVEWIDILHPDYSQRSLPDGGLIMNTTGVPYNTVYGFVLRPLPSDAPPNVDGATAVVSPSDAVTNSGNSPNWINGANQAIALANQVLGNPT